jgi:hypothetical protein
MPALERERSCSDGFARAIECGESVARPLQRGKKTWENRQGLGRLRRNYCGTVETHWFVCLGQIRLVWLIWFVWFIWLVWFSQIKGKPI